MVWLRSTRRIPASCQRALGARGYQHCMATTKTQTSTDAIVHLKDDHKEIRRLFERFEKAGDDAEKTKGKLVDQIIELLTVHTYIENEVMYPRVRELLPDLEDDVLESYEEHHVADLLVVELANMKPGAGG